ncbi:hypothetical protein [Paracoccus laeviglucosivorans]|uniref:Sialate O-acetylesterase domain-containing protein n=1 Tax=Paracoccus laeviglucosivorans TaxID=1197861 RepID=A0A521E3R8_9RHOB|nr:hypothetical protein [Paracoccus laeviglucosivorans]SMO78594.1 hypothetical protein SAMN06265221_11137 [Paracoccus laeviglucosivorans]
MFIGLGLGLGMLPAIAADGNAPPIAARRLSGDTWPAQPQAYPLNLVPQPSGEFGSAAGWSAHAGLTIDTAAGLARWNGTSTGQQSFQIAMAQPAVAGRDYSFAASVPRRAAGQASMGFGTPGAVTAGGVLAAARSRVGRVRATGASLSARFLINAGADLDLDHLRVYDTTALMGKILRIFAGIKQSNGNGAEATPTPFNFFTPEPRAIMIPMAANPTFGAEIDENGHGRPMIACDPMPHQTPNSGGGPGGAFCKKVCEGLSDDEVMVFLCSAWAGGAMLDGGVWDRDAGGAAIVAMEREVDYLLGIGAPGSNVAHVGVCQGEGDRGLDKAPRHRQKLARTITELRAKWGDFPVTIMEIGGADNSPGSITDLMIQEQKKLASNSGDPAALPFCEYIPRRLNAGFRPDGTHYDQTEQEIRGEQEGASALRLNYGAERPTGFALSDAAIAPFGVTITEQWAEALSFVFQGSDPRRRIAWPILPAGTRVRCKVATSGALYFRLSVGDGLGPSGTVDLVPMMNAGNHEIDVIIPPYTTSTHMGFLITTLGTQVRVSDWKVDLPQGL